MLIKCSGSTKLRFKVIRHLSDYSLISHTEVYNFSKPLDKV
ncbi:hypothetical protein SAMN02745746_02326 [Pseudogulbenkiania subflava DSM 22618]|uniref:Uncharacterized protein n=1 Tax=Pseudogulbenkiania subflava DSM 22618 TaxID=1123014 RepID=A0A1Y6BU62_9NEIS|nr:hypothetical protein SAMN02745746_02326 [Pseudogulbenkiania subflava DSM 22618]